MSYLIKHIKRPKMAIDIRMKHKQKINHELKSKENYTIKIFIKINVVRKTAMQNMSFFHFYKNRLIYLLT